MMVFEHTSILEDVQYLFSLFHLKLEKSDNNEIYKILPSKNFEHEFYFIGPMYFTTKDGLGLENTRFFDLMELEEMLLNAREFWWKASKDSEIKNKTGMIILKNPFSDCKTLDEAKIKSDIYGSNSLLNFMFVQDSPSTPFFNSIPSR